MLGATGSGKSFLLNFLVTHAQKYAPLTVVLDLGHSYQKAGDAFGRPLRGGGPPPARRDDQPVRAGADPEHLHFLHAFVRVLLERDDTYRVSDLDDREIYEAVENLYVLDRSQRRLFTLANLLPRALAGRLHKWIGDGRSASVFDNLEDTLRVERHGDSRGLSVGAQRHPAANAPALHDDDGPARRRGDPREFRFDGFLQPPPVDWT